MASGQGSQLDVGLSGASGLAKPLYLQCLERSLKLDSFLRQTAAVFNRDITRYRKRGAECGHSLTAPRLRLVLGTCCRQRKDCSALQQSSMLSR